jgi:hypothetical protein
MTSSSAIPAERIEQHILLIRGQKVMLDADLAELYRVETSALNRRYDGMPSASPKISMFQLTDQEREDLRCQFGTSSSRGGRRYNFRAFTEQGVAKQHAGFAGQA